MSSFQRSGLVSSGRRAWKDHWPSIVLSHLLSSTEPALCHHLHALFLMLLSLFEKRHLLPLYFHRIIEKLRLEVEGTTCHLSLSETVALGSFIQDPVKLNLDYFQWRRFHHFSEQPFLMLKCSHSEYFFSYLDLIFPVVTCACCLLSCCCASLWTQYFSVPLPTFPKLPFGC